MSSHLSVAEVDEIIENRLKQELDDDNPLKLFFHAINGHSSRTVKGKKGKVQIENQLQFNFETLYSNPNERTVADEICNYLKKRGGLESCVVHQYPNKGKTYLCIQISTQEGAKKIAEALQGCADWFCNKCRAPAPAPALDPALFPALFPALVPTSASASASAPKKTMAQVAATQQPQPQPQQQPQEPLSIAQQIANFEASKMKLVADAEAEINAQQQELDKQKEALRILKGQPSSSNSVAQASQAGKTQANVVAAQNSADGTLNLVGLSKNALKALKTNLLNQIAAIEKVQEARKLAKQNEQDNIAAQQTQSEPDNTQEWQDVGKRREEVEQADDQADDQANQAAQAAPPQDNSHKSDKSGKSGKSGK